MWIKNFRKNLLPTSSAVLFVLNRALSLISYIFKMLEHIFIFNTRIKVPAFRIQQLNNCHIQEQFQAPNKDPSFLMCMGPLPLEEETYIILFKNNNIR
jgi:hypothetical protein